MPRLDLDVPDRQGDEEDATDKQKAYIKALCREVGGSIPATTLKVLGKWQASALIDELQSFKAEVAGRKPLDMSRISDADDSSSSHIHPLVSLLVIAAVILLVWLIV
jgi:hypothetical protein